jgi:hypothetical protein
METEYKYVDDEEVVKCVECKSVINENTNVGKACKTPELCYDENGSSIRLDECLWGEA